MILFNSDWHSYPKAIVDLECKNKSFINYCLLLKEMGVKNYKWPLALLHKELQHIDPFDETISVELKELVAVECKLNPWYHFRTIYRATGSTIDNPIYVRANRSNMSLWWLFFNNVLVYLEQPRQTGKTFNINGLDAYLNNIRNRNSRTLLLAKDERLRSEILTEIKNIQNMFPSYLIQQDKKDIANSEELTVSSLDNNYKSILGRSDPIAMDKAPRGHKVENVRTDEAAYISNIQIALQALLPATTAAREKARMINNAYGTIMASTAGKKNDRDGAYVYNYINKLARWSEFFMDVKDKSELEKIIESNSKDGETLGVYCSFTHRQLGYTDEWLKRTAKLNNSYGEVFDRDYLNIWTDGSQNSPFSSEETSLVRSSSSDVKYGEISKYGGIFIRWYYTQSEVEQILSNEFTVFSLDTSNGMGLDDIALNFRRLTTGEVLGACNINQINLITVANFIVNFMSTYPKTILIPENRNQAASIIDHIHLYMLSNNIDPFKRIYNTCVQDYIEYPDRFREIQKTHNYINQNFVASLKKTFGFSTSGGGVTSRTELYGSTLRQAIRYTGEFVRDKTTIDQLLSLVIKNGRVDHASGGNDDLCVAWLLTYWFMSKGKNLSYYGIPNGYIMTQNKAANNPDNIQNLYQTELNKQIKRKIEYLMDGLKNEKDNYVIERVTLEIDSLKTQIKGDDNFAFTVDEMINEIKKNKLSKSFVKKSIYNY